MICVCRWVALVLGALAVLAMAPAALAGGSSDTFVVAAANSSPDCKARANLVCDGVNDEVELLTSITRSLKPSIDLADGLGAHPVYTRYSVRWLPGDYYLDSTLFLPDSADSVIEAEGTYFHYKPATGNAVEVHGIRRCRYRFGAIESSSSGAALCLKALSTAPCLMSDVRFTGLIGHNQRGIGLDLDNSTPYMGITTDRFAGTDISGFDIGIDVGMNTGGTVGKLDTNWFWISSIRMCNTCIWEHGQNTDSFIWDVNVDASLPNSVAIRTGAIYGVWTVIMNCSAGKDVTKGIVLDAGAAYNTFDVPRRQAFWTLQDNSGNATNTFILNP